MTTYTLVENGKVIHTDTNKERIEQWAFILTNTQGRKVEIV